MWCTTIFFTGTYMRFHHSALFLNRFITKTERWAHFDIPAWTDRPKPGRRKGGEASGIRAMYAVIAERYGK